jgi:hypothetical protein
MTKYINKSHLIYIRFLRLILENKQRALTINLLLIEKKRLKFTQSLFHTILFIFPLR